MKQSKDVDLKR